MQQFFSKLKYFLINFYFIFNVGTLILMMANSCTIIKQKQKHTITNNYSHCIIYVHTYVNTNVFTYIRIYLYTIFVWLLTLAQSTATPERQLQRVFYTHTLIHVLLCAFALGTLSVTNTCRWHELLIENRSRYTRSNCCFSK